MGKLYLKQQIIIILERRNEKFGEKEMLRFELHSITEMSGSPPC